MADRAALLEANRQLAELRRQAGITGHPRPISDPVQELADKNGMTVADYFQAIRTGQPTGNEAVSIKSSRRLWESFNSDRHPALQKAVKVIKRWYKERIEQGGAIILAGNCGSGKSHLANAIYEIYGFGAVMWNEIELVKAIQSGYGGGGRSEESIYTHCRRAKLLVYDDLGAYTTQNLEWMQGIYYSLFNARQEAGLATFITTNIPLAQSETKYNAENKPVVLTWSPLEERLGLRCYSRVMGAVDDLQYYVDLFDVPDYRQRNL